MKMRGFYPASFFLESEKLLVLKQAQVPIPMWSNLFNVYDPILNWSFPKFSLTSEAIQMLSSTRSYVFAVYQWWRWNLRYINTSNMLMFPPIHYLIISANWSENPLAPACSTSVLSCTNNKWYTLSLDFCRQIGTDI